MLLATVLLSGVEGMGNYTETERTLGTIIKDLTADLSMLFRSEIALVKLELKEQAAKLGGGAAMIAATLSASSVSLPSSPSPSA
jgi:hypothetical protein